MIMDSNGKLFGKISIVDIAVILVIIIAIAGIYFKFFVKTNKTVVSNSDFYYCVEVKNIRPATAEALEKSRGLTLFLNEKISGEMGTLADLKFTPAVDNLEMENGEIVEAAIPEKFDAIVTIKVSGKINNKGYFTGQLKEINTGATYNLKSKWATIVGTATKVWQ